MTIYSLTYSFPDLEPVCCSMSNSNCCFLTCIQISQEAGQVVWYSHLFKSFPQFIVIHIVKVFGIVNNAKIDVSLALSCFFDDPTDVGGLISGSSAFSKSSLNIWKFMVHVLLKLGTPSVFWLRYMSVLLLKTRVTVGCSYVAGPYFFLKTSWKQMWQCNLFNIRSTLCVCVCVLQ